MTCRDISNASVSSYDTLQQMYVGLGIRRLPTGVYMNVDSAVPSDGINLGLVTPEALECFNTLTGIAGGSSYNASALHGNIREIRELIDYFTGPGNHGDANVITGEEIDAYVNAYGDSLTHSQALTFDPQEYRDLTVSNIAAYVAIVEYLGGGEPAVPVASGNPAEANTAAIHSFGSVQQMYTGLVGELTGEGENVARSSAPEDMPADGIPLGVLNETNIQRFADAIGWDPESDPTTPLARNAYEILTLVDYFRTDGNFEEGGADVITSAEVDAYVRAYVDAAHASGDRTLTFDDYRAITVGNLRAIVSCIQYVSNPPALTAVPVVAEAPDAGPPPEDAGPRVIASVPVEDAGPSESRSEPESSSWLSYACTALGTGAAMLLAGVGLGWMLRGSRGSATVRPASTGGGSSGTSTRTVSESARTEAAPPPPPPPPPPARTGGAAGNPPPPPPGGSAGTPPPEDDMSGLLDALSRARENQTPSAGGTPSSVSLVTSDNIIIEGPNAAPVNGVDPAVVRNQVVLHYRRFLTPAARRGLEDRGEVPAGVPLVNEAFEREVGEITDRIVAAYYERRTAGTLSDLWEAQRDRGYFVRRGVPERLLLEVANGYIEEHATHASSPFSGGEGAAIRTEAERDAGESRFLRDGMREVMRLGGR